ncbi:MAG: hypothetical protein ACC662_06610 [Planctomycetota bacterium]
MTEGTSPPRPPRDACRGWRRRLKRLERDLDRGLTPARGDDTVPETLRHLHAHLRRCASCADRHGRRLDILRARWALRNREIPGGLLDGFYDTVRQATAHAPLGGGMSLAFLDAPRSLRAWRGVALAASLLLVAGATYVFTEGRGAGSTAQAPGEIPLHDARDRLLEAWGTAHRARPSARDVLVRPVAAGDRSFFGRPPRPRRVGPSPDPGMPRVEARWD